MAGKVTSNSAWKDYQSVLGRKPGDFKFSQEKPVWSYDDLDLKAYYDALLNREDFSFDLNNNALYNQYKDFYTKRGNLAMMDTIGQASAMTGGYGNSYAASAGQQAYQQNLDKLGEMVPEVYNLALQQYQLEGEQLYNKYALAAGERDTSYGQYVDALNQYYTDYDMAYQQHSDVVDRWYADVDRAYGVYGDARDYEYQQERAAVADSQWAKEFAAEQAARDKEYAMWQQEFAAEQAALDKEYAMWEKEFNEKYGKNETTLGKGVVAGAELGASAIAGISAQSTQSEQTKRLVALNMSEEEEKVVMDAIADIQNRGMVGDTARLREFIGEYAKDLNYKQLKALGIIFLGE